MGQQRQENRFEFSLQLLPERVLVGIRTENGEAEVESGLTPKGS